MWNNEEREKKRKESKKVRDGLKEQIWRNEEEQVERVVRDKTKKQLCLRGSLTTVEHLVHGEGLQEVGAWVRDARFPPPCGGRGRRGRGL